MPVRSHRGDFCKRSVEYTQISANDTPAATPFAKLPDLLANPLLADAAKIPGQSLPFLLAVEISVERQACSLTKARGGCCRVAESMLAEVAGNHRRWKADVLPGTTGWAYLGSAGMVGGAKAI